MPRMLALNADGSLMARDTDDDSCRTYGPRDRSSNLPGFIFDDARVYRVVLGGILIERGFDGNTLISTDTIRQNIVEMLRLLDDLDPRPVLAPPSLVEAWRAEPPPSVHAALAREEAARPRSLAAMQGWDTRRRKAEASQPPPAPWHSQIMDDD